MKKNKILLFLVSILSVFGLFACNQVTPTEPTETPTVPTAPVTPTKPEVTPTPEPTQTEVVDYAASVKLDMATESLKAEVTVKQQ